MAHNADESLTLQALAGLESSALSDALEGLGFAHQVLGPQYRPMGGHVRMAGRAACALLGPKEAPAPGAPLPGDYFAAIDELAAPGRILVLAIASGTRGAVLGGFMAREYRKRGAVGVITDGLLRDVAELATLDLALIATGATPCNGAKGMRIDSVRQPLALGGAHGTPVTVEDGDYVLADEDGVVVVPARIVAVAIEATRVLIEIERRIGADMAGGLPRVQAMRAHDRFGHLPALRASLASLR